METRIHWHCFVATFSLKWNEKKLNESENYQLQNIMGRVYVEISVK